MTSKTVTFTQDGSMYYYVPDGMSGKAICFDLDWTLTYGANHLFPKNITDIHILPRRASKLDFLVSKGWCLVIYTNQFSRGTKDLANKLGRVAHFVQNSKWKFAVFIATKKDINRKPNIGMYTKACELLSDCDQRMFVGDAAGRQQDFAASDREFADNADLKFKTPEEIFQPKIPKMPSSGKNLVVLVGMPGCGKSAFYKDYLAPLGYVHINQDTLTTAVRVMVNIKKAIYEGNNVCIDNLNNILEKRCMLYELANEYGYIPTTVYFVRDGRGWNNIRQRTVPTIVYHKYFKHFVEPTVSNTPGKLHRIC
jgi:bifunctional polynucleotide phosphatase/kinase